jgi:hypothetical protein
MGIHFVGVKPKERRIKCLRVEADMFLHIANLDGTKLVRAEPQLPTDAHVVGFTVDEAFNTITLYIESMAFEPVQESLAFPELNIVFHTWEPCFETNDLGEPVRLGFGVDGYLPDSWRKALDKKAMLMTQDFKKSWAAVKAGSNLGLG